MQEGLKSFNTKEIILSDTIEMKKNFININTPQELYEQSRHT